MKLFVSMLGCHTTGEVQPHSFLSLKLYEVETTWYVCVCVCVCDILKHYDVYKYLHKELN